MTSIARRGLVASALSVVVAVAGCAPAVVPAPAVTNTLVPMEHRDPVVSPPPDPRPAQVWPLTGLDATDATPEDLGRTALSIKIENSDAAKPQHNVQYADTVYETMVDYGISRLIAVYQSNYPDEVGPIRSMRPMDENIIGSYKGPLIFSGAQKRFIQKAASDGQDLIAQDLGDGGFFRTHDKPAPHNLHGTLATFAKEVKSPQAPPEQYLFAYPAETATATVSGKSASAISIVMSPYAKPNWKWDSKKSKWMRYERSSPHVMDNGTQLSADTIVILRVAVKYTTHVHNGISVPETLVAGKSGKGFVASDGKYVAIKWSKKSRTAPFVLTTVDGYPVYLKPGVTWFELVPNSGTGYTQSVDFS